MLHSLLRFLLSAIAVSAGASVTASVTASASVSACASVSATATVSASASVSASVSVSASATASASVSASAIAPPPHRNAATRYVRAFEHMATLDDGDWELIYDYYSNPGAPTPLGLERTRGRVTRAIDAAVRGSRLPTSAYELDWDQGYAMLLTHLGPMRNLAKLMRHDVMVRLHAGDVRGATERIAAMYRMSRHPADDGTMISSLVGMAIFDLADTTAQTSGSAEP